MAIQPSPRPFGSEHILRFTGNITIAVGNAQEENGEAPPSAVADARANIMFALADLTDLTDLTRQLPLSVYDNVNDASNTTAGGPAIPVPPLLGAPSGQAWEQNIRVRVQELGESTATPLIDRVDVLTCSAIRDGAITSLINAEGIPVVIIPFFFNDDGITALGEEGVPVVVEIEVPHTEVR